MPNISGPVLRDGDDAEVLGGAGTQVYVTVGELVVYIDHVGSGIWIRVWEEDDRRQSNFPIKEVIVSFNEEDWPQ